MWFRAVATAGAVVVTPVFLGKVQTATCEPRRIKPCQLPIYENATEEYVYVEEKHNDLRDAFKNVRNVLAEEAPVIQKGCQQVGNTVDSMKAYVNGFIEQLQRDNGAVSRAAFITVAGLSGIVLGYKRSMLRRTLYVGTLMTAATAIAYPKQSVDITRTGWYHSSDLARSLWQNLKKAGKDSESKDSTSSEKVEEETSSKLDVVKTDEASSATKSVEGDHGMSNPADKDMYTTRDG